MRLPSHPDDGSGVISLTAEKDKNSLSICIKDNGVGIPSRRTRAHISNRLNASMYANTVSWEPDADPWCGTGSINCEKYYRATWRQYSSCKASRTSGTEITSEPAAEEKINLQAFRPGFRAEIFLIPILSLNGDFCAGINTA